MKPNSIKILIRETNLNYYGWSLIADGFLFSPTVKRYLGKSVTYGLQEIVNDSGQYGFDIKNWNELGRSCVERLQDGRLSVTKLSSEHRFLGERIKKLCRLIERENMRAASSQQIKNWLQGLWKDYLELNALGFIPVVSDFDHNYLTIRLISILRVHDVPEDKIQNVLSTLISPIVPTLFWREQKELLELALKYGSAKKILGTADFGRHVEKYQWLNYGYQGPVWTTKDFEERLGRIFAGKSSVSQQFREHIRYSADLQAQQKGILKKIGLSAREKRLFDAAKQFVYLKGYRVEVRHYFGYISDLIFSELSRRFRLHPKFFRFTTRDETIKALEGKRVNEKAVLARIKHTIEGVPNKKRKFYPPREGKRIIERYVQKEEAPTRSADLKGQIAYAGRARGTAKIVNSIKDLYKVHHSDILVATTTNPDFLPAMYRAIAFVTDVGGITSHAAIVSREMKKPCVIGTKFATKVLKDGDMVEVDANKGIVRKL